MSELHTIEIVQKVDDQTLRSIKEFMRENFGDKGDEPFDFGDVTDNISHNFYDVEYYVDFGNDDVAQLFACVPEDQKIKLCEVITSEDNIPKIAKAAGVPSNWLLSGFGYGTIYPEEIPYKIRDPFRLRFIGEPKVGSYQAFHFSAPEDERTDYEHSFIDVQISPDRMAEFTIVLTGSLYIFMTNTVCTIDVPDDVNRTFESLIGREIMDGEYVPLTPQRVKKLGIDRILNSEWNPVLKRLGVMDKLKYLSKTDGLYYRG